MENYLELDHITVESEEKEASSMWLEWKNRTLQVDEEIEYQEIRTQDI